MGITHFCFGLSYLTALGMDLLQIFQPAHWKRLVSIFFGVAGLLAHTIFLAMHQPSPASPYGSLLLLGWVFAVFYTYGNLHQKPTLDALRAAVGAALCGTLAGLSS